MAILVLLISWSKTTASLMLIDDAVFERTRLYSNAIIRIDINDDAITRVGNIISAKTLTSKTLIAHKWYQLDECSSQLS